MRVPYNYLPRQFDAHEVDAILQKLRAHALTGDFTLGAPVAEFERRFAAFLRARHVIGVSSGTDALILALRALQIGPGDEVITQVNTFYATVGAIVEVGATPGFVDVDETYSMDPDQLFRAVSSRTRAVIPVHWRGLPADMPAIQAALGSWRGIEIIEDACPAAGASIGGRSVGLWGRLAAFSFHPLKPLHVWGDGGAVVTEDDALAAWLRRYRSHGLISRDEVGEWGVNRRLQTVQAVIANHVLDRVRGWIERRTEIAARLDHGLADVAGISVPPRPADRVHAYQLYMVKAERRDALVAFLERDGVEAKIHYPIPLHLQPAAKGLGYGPGDFPVAEAQARRIVTLPAHQYLSDAEVDFMLERVRAFYGA